MALVAFNITTCSDEEIEIFGRISKELQGPGFFVIIAGNSAVDFAYKKKVWKRLSRTLTGSL